MSRAHLTEADPSMLGAQQLEHIPPHPETARLHEIYFEEDGMDMVMSEAREKFWKLADNLEAAQTEEREAALVRTTAKLLDYNMFAYPGTPLPEGFLLTRNQHYGTLSCHFDFSNPLRGDNASRVIDAFKEAGLEELKAKIIDEFPQDIAGLTERTETWIRDLPEYQFLASFAEQAPLGTEELPLNPFWQQIRQAQIESDVRERYGINNKVSLNTNYQANHENQKAAYHLGDETMPGQTEAAIRTPFEKVHEFFGAVTESALKDSRYWEAEDPDNAPEDTIFAQGPWRLTYEEHPSLKHEGSVQLIMSDGYKHSATEMLSGNYSKVAGTARRHYGYEVTQDGFYDKALSILLDPDYQFDTYEAYIETVVSEYADMIYGSITDLADDNVVDSSGYFSGQYRLLRYKMPSGSIVDYRDYINANNAFEKVNVRQEPYYYDVVGQDFERSIALSSREHADQLRRKTLAVVVQRPPVHVRTPLFLQTKRLVEDIPELDGVQQDQLVIRSAKDARGKHGRDFFCSVPGFDIAGTHQGNLVFSPAAHNPYDVPPIPLAHGNNVKELLQQYRNIGFDKLADSIERDKTRTVPGLVFDIARLARYHYDDKTDGLPRLIKPQSIEDFAPWMKDGALQAQCDGADVFLGLSLEHLFGRGSVVSQFGHMIKSETDRISQVGHVQTMFRYGGKSYLLDATPIRMGSGLDDYPSIESSLDRAAGLNGLLSGSIETASFTTAAQFTTLQAAEIPRVPSEVLTAKNTETKRQQTIDKIEQQLIWTLGVPNADALYKSLLDKPEHDPLRRMALLVRRAISNKVVASEIHAQIKYLETLKTADVALKRRRSVEKYEEQVLENLRRQAQELLEVL